MLGGKFAPLTMLDADDTDMDTLIDTFNTAVIETASNILANTELSKTLGHNYHP